MANKKFLITFLGLAVLLQLSFAVPMPDDDSKSTEESDGKVNIKATATLSLNTVAEKIVPKQVEVLREVLKDLEAQDNPTEEDEASTKEIQHFLENYDEDLKEEHDYKLAVESLFVINSIVEPSDDKKKNLKVSKLLDEHGWLEVRNAFDAEIEPKIDDLAAKVKTYLDNLDEAEKEKEKQLTKWLKKFDDKENDIGDKTNLLLDLVVDDDSDESK